MAAPVYSTSLFKQIQQKAFSLGFDLCEVANPDIPERDQKALQSWCNDGSAAEMTYMVRDPEKRSRPTEMYPGVGSILSLGVSYYQGPVPPKPAKHYGRVARYAWGKDYHDIILARLESLQSYINDQTGSSKKATLAVDTKPLLEKPLAASAGLGFIGKNTILISSRPTVSSPGRFHIGSWVFLAEILLEGSFEQMDSENKYIQGCGGCRRCLDVCPTDAFEEAYKLNSSKCISYLTIENKGWIPIEIREKIGDWIFGCDLCQDVCPFNTLPFETRWPELKSDQGVGAWIDLKKIFNLKDQSQFKTEFSGTPLLRSKRKGLVRNGLVVAGNSGDQSLIPFVENLIDDAEPLVRAHALWAYSKLESRERVKQRFEKHLLLENDAQVKTDIATLQKNL